MNTIGFSELEEVWGPGIQSKVSRRKMKNQKRDSKSKGKKMNNFNEFDDPIFGVYDKKYRRHERDSEFDTLKPSKVSNRLDRILDDDIDIDMLDISDVREDFRSDDDKYYGLSKPDKDKDKDIRVNKIFKPNENFANKTNENHDVFLYVFSGVILLFILEQFIQVGLHLGIRKTNP